MNKSKYITIGIVVLCFLIGCLDKTEKDSETEQNIFKENALKLTQYIETAGTSRNNIFVLDSIIQSLEIPENQLTYVNDIIDLADNNLSLSDLRNSSDILNEEAYDELGEIGSLEILSISSILINSTEYWYENTGNWDTLLGSSPKIIATMLYCNDLCKADIGGAVAGAYYSKTWQGTAIGAALASIAYAISGL